MTLAALAPRLYRALHAPAIPDEEICIGIAAGVLRPGQPWVLHGGDHPALGVYLLAASAWLFGGSLAGYRMLGVLAGTATVPLAGAAVLRSSSREAALLAAGLIAANPFHVGLSSGAFEMVFEILFVTLAWLSMAGLPRRGRRGLVLACVWLGLAFLCNESAALVGVAWALALALRPRLREGLRPRDLALAAGAFLVVVLPDLAYNLAATRPDYRYVNYLDHLARIAAPDATLRGLGFFLRDGFSRLLPDAPALWADNRDEYLGPGIVLGALLLAGFVHAFTREGDPTGGLWRLPPLLLVLVTSFTRPAGPSPLDAPSWTWPAPALPLVSAASGVLLVRCLHAWRRRSGNGPPAGADPRASGEEPYQPARGR